MDHLHRENVLVTSCLRTPVDPQKKVPLALYERERFAPYRTGHMDKRDYVKQSENNAGSNDEDTGCQDSQDISLKDYSVHGDRGHSLQFSSSNQEYYRKVEQLKHAHLETMAHLEAMCQHKLDLGGVTATTHSHSAHQDHSLWWGKNCVAPMSLRKVASALELNHADDSSRSDTSEEGLGEVELLKGAAPSPKEHIKDMWQAFEVEGLTSSARYSSCPSLKDEPRGTDRRAPKGKTKGVEKQNVEEHSCGGWRHRVTVPRPFQMTLREAERRQSQARSRSEVELENALLKKQLEELAECGKKFRASPAPAHLHQPLYKEISEREEERHLLYRRQRERKEKEREESRGQRVEPKEQRRAFRARPVPRSVYDPTASERLKEELLYRAIKMQMRSWELLHNASSPCSMLARRSGARHKSAEVTAAETMPSFRPKITSEVPDFDASYRRFRKHMQEKRDVKPVTVCEPFQLRTACVPSRRGRVPADFEEDRTSPRVTRWPRSAPAGTTCSSLDSTPLDSQEPPPAKITGAAKMRQEAVRKVLEQRKQAEMEEENWRAMQKEKERKLQKVITMRALANDPHVSLSQTCPVKLQHFRKQDLQRKKEYEQVMQEIRERVKERPFLLEQVAQRNAKQAVEKHFAEALREFGLSEQFVCSKVTKVPVTHQSQGGSWPSTDTSTNKSEGPEASETFLDDYADDYDEYEGLGEREEDESKCGRQTDIDEDGQKHDQSELEGKDDRCGETSQQCLDQQ